MAEQSSGVKKPVIAIRPIIDARMQGVRESMESKTRTMAAQAAELVTANLRYPDGTPVKAVVYPGTIGRAGEAREAKEFFAQYRVAGELTVTPSWCYVTEVMDLDPAYPHAIWGFNGTERPGAVTLAANLSAYAQFGVPAFGIYGRDVQDADDDTVPAEVAEKILVFARSALAVSTMKDSNYLQIGSACMGIAGSIVDRHFLKDYLGMGTESVDMTEIVRRIEQGIFDPEEYATAREWVREHIQVGQDFNPAEKQFSAEDKEAQWDYVTKMTLVAKDLMEGNPRLAEIGWPEEAIGHNALAAGFQGQRQWTDFWPNGDFMETMLNTTFDWNGAREPKVFATENDVLNGISMLFNYLLTNRTQMFSDVRTYWSPKAVKRVTGVTLDGVAADGFLDLRNSGPTSLDASGGAVDGNGNPTWKPWWEMTNADVEACLGKTTFHAATVEYFRGGGFSTHFSTPGGMPVTMCRINLVDGLGPVLQIAEGHTVELPEEAMATIENRTDRTWPTTFFAPRLTGEGAFKSVYDVMDNWGANHGAIGYGHFGHELITLAAMLRIPVNMHNVESERIFRPRAWGLHGTQNSEPADFAACKNYGPLYR